MDRLIFTAASGMTASMNRERVLASNLANTQTVGFRAETIESTPMTLEGPQLQARALNATQVHGADMKGGVVSSTGRTLDVALAGDALLAVAASDGGEAYTRRGDLNVSATGLLENGEGYAVLGEDGPVTVPLGQKITISPEGAIMAADPATPETAPAEVARLKLVNWRGSKVEKGLDGLFRVEGGGVLPTDGEAAVMPASLEQSNVSATKVLVEMVEAQRLFEIRSKLLSTARELDQGGTSLMRITS